jgi:hypothetical protein
MSSTPDLLTQYGLPIVFAWTFAVQAGAPAPALPMLIGAGALSGGGRMDLALAIAAATEVRTGSARAPITSVRAPPAGQGRRSPPKRAMVAARFGSHDDV